MDAHQLVTLEEGDRYPLVPPKIRPCSSVVELSPCKRGVGSSNLSGGTSFAYRRGVIGNIPVSKTGVGGSWPSAYANDI